MPFHVDTQPEHATIRVVFSGAVTVAERFRAMTEIVALQQQTQYAKLLADFRHATVVATSQEETSTYATRLAQELPPHRMKIAYVGEATQTASVEALAALRGYFYQRFRTPGEAMRWLG
jgi:hypothetical protein